MEQRIKTLFVGGLLALALFGAAMAGSVEDGRTAYQNGDYADALRLWRPLASQGNAIAQAQRGFMYANGQGVTQDYAEAAKWDRLAADQGDANAQLNLGSLFANGEGVPQISNRRLNGTGWLQTKVSPGRRLLLARCMP